MSKLITMQDPNGRTTSRLAGVRDRRYTIRFPFAADVLLIDLETGQEVEGVTSDISQGGCFVCTSKPLVLNRRARMKLTRNDLVLEGLVVVRIVKPRIGMGIEFFDLEAPNDQRLNTLIEHLRRSR